MDKTILKKELKIFAALAAAFLFVYMLPLGNARVQQGISEALELTQWYAREHVVLCLLPAFFIAGAIGVFIKKESVMKYLGPGANKILAYGVSSVSGSVLAVCSCTVLPLFSGIYRMGAGLGPATTFLYSGPAINVLAIILTARVLGVELGLARAVGAVVFSIIIGALMQFIFRHEKHEKARAAMYVGDVDVARPLWQNGIFFALLVGILIFANWGSGGDTEGFWFLVSSAKWYITASLSVLLMLVLIGWFKLVWWKLFLAALPAIVLGFVFPGYPVAAFAAGIGGLAVVTAEGNQESKEWFSTSWDFAKQIFPLLLGGVLVAGFLLGRPGHEGIVPSQWVSAAVGGNSLSANFFAAVAGAFMYFATLTEIPIIQGLMGSGMGKGPALALLLAGPALSLPNMLVIRGVLGTKKTFVYVTLVVVMATFSGLIFGMM